jgi:hypothetical protein
MPPNRVTPRKHVQWNLLINTVVEIRLHGQTIRTGLVEDVMPDSSALWLAADSENPRQIFEVCQGHQIWVTHTTATQRRTQLPDDNATNVRSNHHETLNA